VVEATASLGAAKADIAATEAAVTQTMAEIAKLEREVAEFGLADAKAALRLGEFPLLIVARLIFEDEVIWARSLDTQRMLLRIVGTLTAETSGGNYTWIEGEFQERSEASYDVAGELTPGKPLKLELELLGPALTEGPLREGPEIFEGTLETPSIAIVYDPEPAPAVN